MTLSLRPCRQLIFLSLYVCHFEEIFCKKLVGEFFYCKKIWEEVSHIFLSCFHINFWVGATTHQESMISKTLHPTSLHIEIKGVLFYSYACKGPEREAFTLRGVLGMVSWRERRGESSSLGVCAKIRFLGFWSSGFEKKEKIRKKLFFTPSFFHFFISSKSPSLISEKVLEI